MKKPPKIDAVVGAWKLRVAPDDELIEIRVRQHGQIGDPGIGRLSGPPEQGGEAAQEPIGPRPVEHPRCIPALAS